MIKRLKFSEEVKRGQPISIFMQELSFLNHENFKRILTGEKTEGISEGKRNFILWKKLALAFSTQVKKGEKILVKVSISPTGYEGAAKNMLAEGKSNDFTAIEKQAVADWNKELSKIEVKSSDKNKLAVFYTAMYHVFTQPNINMDVDGKYRGEITNSTWQTDSIITVFSLWDTFREHIL
jgi:putative alpha-1,2-mannosidase